MSNLDIHRKDNALHDNKKKVVGVEVEVDNF